MYAHITYLQKIETTPELERGWMEYILVLIIITYNYLTLLKRMSANSNLIMNF